MANKFTNYYECAHVGRAESDAEAINAMRTMNNAQLHLINTRSNGAFFDGTVREYRSYTDACGLLHEGKMSAQRVISPLSPRYVEVSE